MSLNSTGIMTSNLVVLLITIPLASILMKDFGPESCSNMIPRLKFKETVTPIELYYFEFSRFE